MDAWQPTLVLLGVVGAGLTALYGLGLRLAAVRTPLETGPFAGGLKPGERAVSRFHVR
ncbi:hypothetical protein [Streptomyces sp. D2-8]|uniref:hypothetical protein n=1 Tax=Streptomyces sp. D2-8 TaxID=2707767 RepID=UPI0027E3DAA9|nr:hypothetical protein [Streptomyces sp. D2-8]